MDFCGCLLKPVKVPGLFTRQVTAILTFTTFAIAKSKIWKF